ncbi:MAG: 2-amino-4-hydroxy-6-hydroxymethyldihydropteridine diphosphokinase [Bacteroidales bacterium]|nr:2-amino-4-hydroxy-6-hydroxymethyldihydropteridine diphosphokinase [Bacteroidales bacterium]
MREKLCRPVYLALGSNLGDRRANIAKAVALLDARFGAHVALSSLYETKADGFDGPDFVNAAVRYDLDLEPMDILRQCLAVEIEMGRPAHGIELDEKGRRIYRSRIIDIDILLAGDETLRTPELEIPHPRMKEREFVMVPLGEILGIS